MTTAIPPATQDVVAPERPHLRRNTGWVRPRRTSTASVPEERDSASTIHGSGSSSCSDADGPEGGASPPQSPVAAWVSGTAVLVAQEDARGGNELAEDVAAPSDKGGCDAAVTPPPEAPAEPAANGKPSPPPDAKPTPKHTAPTRAPVLKPKSLSEPASPRQLAAVERQQHMDNLGPSPFDSTAKPWPGRAASLPEMSEPPRRRFPLRTSIFRGQRRAEAEKVHWIDFRPSKPIADVIEFPMVSEEVALRRPDDHQACCVVM